MIDPAFVQRMARYNAWQNGQLMEALRDAPPAVVTLNRRAFFGSILGTLNHILWGDRMWLSRFDTRLAPPDGGIEESVSLTQSVADWVPERDATDQAILLWARELRRIDVMRSITFTSRVLGRQCESPIAGCIMHFFNHQTHHRGQVHAMMTAAGLDAPVSDLFMMPEDI